MLANSTRITRKKEQLALGKFWTVKEPRKYKLWSLSVNERKSNLSQVVDHTYWKYLKKLYHVLSNYQKLQRNKTGLKRSDTCINNYNQIYWMWCYDLMFPPFLK